MSWARAAAFVLPAAAYVASASVEPASWDTAELQGVPYLAGIAHPTGFPLYVLTGYLWSHAVAEGTVAFRLNAFCGIAIALAALAAYALARELGAARAVALAATLWFAFTENVWMHAARAEAQDLAVACEAFAIYAFVRWMRRDEPGAFAAAFALCGLGMAAHPNALWILPAFGAGALIARRRPSLRLASIGAALCALPLALYLYLPLRSAYVAAHGLDPAAGLPGVNGGIFWNYNDPRTLHGMLLEITGSQFQTPGYFLAAFNPAALQNALAAFASGLYRQYGAVATLLIAGGLVAGWRRDWRATLVVVFACTAALLFSVVYPNESDVGRYRLLAAWVAVPLLGALAPQSNALRERVLRAALVAVLAAGAALSLYHQRGYFSRPAGEGGRWVIDAVGSSVPQGSVVVTGWLDATSLAYGAYVDKTLPNRIVVSDDHLRVGLYRRWAARRPVFVLADPHDVPRLLGTSDYATLDAYHELFRVLP